MVLTLAKLPVYVWCGAVGCEDVKRAEGYPRMGPLIVIGQEVAAIFPSTFLPKTTTLTTSTVAHRHREGRQERDGRRRDRVAAFGACAFYFTLPSASHRSSARRKSLRCNAVNPFPHDAFL